VDEVVQIGDQVVALNEGRVMRQGSAKEITLIQSE
jgi:ABC-type proline/glycine betaine transport system ATPase subunit